MASAGSSLCSFTGVLRYTCKRRQAKRDRNEGGAEGHDERGRKGGREKKGTKYCCAQPSKQMEKESTFEQVPARAREGRTGGGAVDTSCAHEPEWTLTNLFLTVASISLSSFLLLSTCSMAWCPGALGLERARSATFKSARIIKGERRNVSRMGGGEGEQREMQRSMLKYDHAHMHAGARKHTPHACTHARTHTLQHITTHCNTLQRTARQDVKRR